MKITNGILALLFTYFAVVQINDPDPVLWVLVYSFAVMICVQAILGRSKIYFLIVGAVTFIALAATRIPGFIGWLRSDQYGELFGEMIYDKPYIEETREFIGLLIALAAIVYNWIVLRRQKRRREPSS